jgi:hypothetical protein
MERDQPPGAIDGGVDLSGSSGRLDVIMNEDQQRNRSDNGPNNLSILRRGTERHAEGDHERLPARQDQVRRLG